MASSLILSQVLMHGWISSITYNILIQFWSTPPACYPTLLSGVTANVTSLEHGFLYPFFFRGGTQREGQVAVLSEWYHRMVHLAMPKNLAISIHCLVFCGTSYSCSRRDTMMWSCSTSAVPHCQHQPAGKAWWCWCVHCRRHLLALRGLQSWVSTKVWISSVLFHLLSLTFPNFDNIIVFCPSGTSFSSENSSKLCSLNDSPGVSCFHYSLVGRLGNHARNTCGTHRWCWWVCCSCLPCIDCWGMLYSPSLAACRVRWDWLGNLGKHCSCQCNHSRVTLEWLLFILSLFKGSEEMVLGCIQLWRKVSIAGGSKGGMVQCVKLTM